MSSEESGDAEAAESDDEEAASPTSIMDLDDADSSKEDTP
jgi:hypothetical protein